MASYKKLVRDNIPEIIRKRGSEPVTRILNEKEYLAELVKKLHEEVAEFEADHSAEELADIQEVVLSISEALGIAQDSLEEVRIKKAVTNGRFQRRIYLEDVKE